MMRSNQIQSLSDPIWSGGDSGFLKKVGYPFPEILRSPEECVNAMDWITKHVLDLYDDPTVNLSQWFDFIWTKFWCTRKRLIQLHLDDLEGVGILERCARFHIYCAHAFVEIPEPLFIAKFNFEHLGKCLITLKYLYHDLNGRDIYCANEAEFLCYYLIHFPKSYRDLIEFNPVVRQSKPIQFALKFLEALNTSNFVSFFNLVKEATYLQACILHRYFLPMRERALAVMCKSYNRSPTTIFNVSVNQMMSLLAFEDTTELESYLKYAGIDYDFENVSFMQSCFVGAGPRPEWRASEVAVEYKRRKRSMQDIITGGEGLLLSSNQEIYHIKSNIYPNDDNFGETVTKQIRSAEAIWKSIFFQIINDKIIETFTRLRYPHGEPEYEYDDQSTIGSVVSELDGTRNESNAEIVFEENVEKEAENQQTVANQITEVVPTMESLLPEPEPYIDPEPEPEPERQPEPEPVIITPSKVTPELKGPNPTPQSSLIPRTRMRAARARLIMKARIPVLAPDQKSNSKLEPELVPEPQQEQEQEQEQEPEQESEQEPEREVAPEPESKLESESGSGPGPSGPRGTPEPKTDDEQGSKVDQELNDSNLVVSDGDEPKNTEDISKRAMSLTMASILRAVDRYNKQHGKRL